MWIMVVLEAAALMCIESNVKHPCSVCNILPVSKRACVCGWVIVETFFFLFRLSSHDLFHQRPTAHLYGMFMEAVSAYTVYFCWFPCAKEEQQTSVLTCLEIQNEDLPISTQSQLQLTLYLFGCHKQWFYMTDKIHYPFKELIANKRVWN